MQLDLITRDEFLNLVELLKAQIEEVRDLIEKKPKVITNKELKELFNWSDAKIYRLRCKGILKSNEVNGSHYYNYDEVMDTFRGKVKKK